MVFTCCHTKKKKQTPNKKPKLAPLARFQGFKPDNLQLVQLRDGCHYLPHFLAKF